MGNHFIAVGGTGQHVALALIDLAALAHHILPLKDAPQFYVLDRDQTSTHVPTAWQLALEQIDRLRAATARDERQWPKAHDASIAPSRDLVEPTAGAAVCPTYGPQLFTEDQMGVEYRAGYFGQAPVAAGFFGDLLRSEAGRTGGPLQQIFGETGRRVVVAGSVVGGTGAGCMPRLVEELGKSNTGAKADVMALVLLRWFGLEPKDSQSQEQSRVRNAEMRSREPSALLYARNGLAERAATVLVGHPFPEQSGTPRAWAGDTQQPPHDNLAIPLYAAIAASGFLFGRGQAERGIYSIARPGEEPNGDPGEGNRHGLELPRSVWLFGETDGNPVAQLGNLVRRNLDLCERMRWVLAYLEQRPDARFALAPSVLRVDPLELILDSAKAPNLTALKTGLRKLLDAKWAALVRIQNSDAGFLGVQLARSPEEHFVRLERGLGRLREWVGADRIGEGDVFSLTDITSRLLSTLGPQSVMLDKQSAHRCLPPAVVKTNELGGKPHPVGTLEPMDLSATEQIIAAARVAPRSLPTPNTIEFFLQQVFEGTLRVEPSAERNASEQQSEIEIWTRRWRTLFLLLAAKRCTLVPAPEDRGRVTLVPPEARPEWLIAYGKQIVGSTSHKTLLVPAVQADWDELESDPAVDKTREAARIGGSWFDLVRQLADETGESRTSPGWLRYNASWFDGIDKGNRSDEFALNQQAIQAQWVTERRAIYLPLIGVRNDLEVDRVLSSFGISSHAISPRDVAHRPELHALSAADCPVYEPFGSNGDRRRRKVVWADLHPDLAAKLRFGFFLARDGGGNVIAYRVQSPDFGGIEVLRLDDVKLGTVQPVGDNAQNKRMLPDYPVRLRYAGLIDLSQPTAKPEQGAGLVTYRLPLKGRGVETVRAIDGAMLAATLMLWPKFRSTAKDPFVAYHSLVNTNQQGRVAWFFGSEDGRSGMLDWSTGPIRADTRSAPLYRKPGGSAIAGGVPELFTLALERPAGIGPTRPSDDGIGLFRTGLEDVETVADETWGVDFGTSSSVVAIHGNRGTDAHVLTPDGALDQTIAYAVDSAVHTRDCYWFPTWDGYGPRTTQPRGLFPSQLFWTGELPAAQDGIETETYGRSFVLDHGGVVVDRLRKRERILTDLKWFESHQANGISLAAQNRQRASRRTYLVHLLELATALRPGVRSDLAGLEKGLPAAVRVVFTLPLRMRQTESARAFGEDAAAVCKTLRVLTGITFESAFLWESHAGRPKSTVRNDHDLYAVADLGGGSLDMWGCIGRDDRREFADSYRFGGHDLINQWDGVGDGDLRHRLRTDAKAALTDIFKQQSGREAGLGFFDLGREAVVRWIAGLAVEAAQTRGIYSSTVRLSLLGMGWGLKAGFEDKPGLLIEEIGLETQRFLDDIGGASGVAQRIHVNVVPGDDLQAGVARKTYIARTAAQDRGSSLDDLNRAQVERFLGFDVSQEPTVGHGDGANVFGWHRTLPLSLGAGDGGRILLEARNVLAQPRPPLRYHKLSQGELQRLVDEINEGNHGTIYDGLAPISRVLEFLRIRSKRAGA